MSRLRINPRNSGCGCTGWRGSSSSRPWCLTREPAGRPAFGRQPPCPLQGNDDCFSCMPEACGRGLPMRVTASPSRQQRRRRSAQINSGANRSQDGGRLIWADLRGRLQMRPWRRTGREGARPPWRGPSLPDGVRPSDATASVPIRRTRPRSYSDRMSVSGRGIANTSRSATPRKPSIGAVVAESTIAARSMRCDFTFGSSWPPGRSRDAGKAPDRPPGPRRHSRRKRSALAFAVARLRRRGR